MHVRLRDHDPALDVVGGRAVGNAPEELGIGSPSSW